MSLKPKLETQETNADVSSKNAHIKELLQVHGKRWGEGGGTCQDVLVFFSASRVFRIFFPNWINLMIASPGIFIWFMAEPKSTVPVLVLSQCKSNKTAAK